jgi:hypothetical protein
MRPQQYDAYLAAGLNTWACVPHPAVDFPYFAEVFRNFFGRRTTEI